MWPRLCLLSLVDAKIRLRHTPLNATDAQPTKLNSIASCAQDGEFEDEVDLLSWRFFNSPLAAEDLSKANKPEPLSSMSQRREAMKKAVNVRLSNWLRAVERSQNTSVKPDMHVPHGDAHLDGLEIHPEYLNHSEFAHLPPFCPWSVPAGDEYWRQSESYKVWDGSQYVYYNECRYSNGCKTQYTNSERVTSIRNTLAVTHGFLNKHGVEHSLYGGSNIGAYRCKDVLPWDVDSDVMVMHDQIAPLLKFLEGADGTYEQSGWQRTGRMTDLAPHGFDGFVLMEKYPGCMPLVVVDKSTGFFTDIFPVRREGDRALTPWWNGKIPCDSQALFNGCHNGRCKNPQWAKAWPPSSCHIHWYPMNCPAKLHAFLVDEFGPNIDEPDIATRGLRQR